MERTKKMIFRVTEQEQAIIQRKAKAQGMSTAEYLRHVTAQDERLERLDKRMDDLSMQIDKNSVYLEEHRKTIYAIEDAIKRGAFDEVQELASKDR